MNSAEQNVFFTISSIIFFCLLTGVIAISLVRRRYAVQGWRNYRPMSIRPTITDRNASESFLSENSSLATRFDGLVQYFLDGYMSNADSSYSRVNYPGMGSSFGYDISGLEGFARTAPLLAACLYSGRTDSLKEDKQRIIEVLRIGLLSGTDIHNRSYWGRMCNNDQRIVEAADIARILWLSREHIWFKLSSSEKNQISMWLEQVNNVTITRRNNWILFPVVVGSVLKALGQKNEVDYSAYFEFKANYLECGWYFDAPHGVDYYNPWGISYDLYWIYLLEPTLDSIFIKKSLTESAVLTAHLISPKGIPIMGRSSCYRTGIPSPLIAAAAIQASEIPAGMARRSLDLTWRHFIANNSLRDGTLTQGYFETDHRIVDRYTGPGSSHWGLRSLVLAYMLPSHHALWTDPEIPLPVESGDYRLELSKLGWIVSGKTITGEIEIIIPANTLAYDKVKNYSWWRRYGEYIFHRPLRPFNDDLRYHLKSYSSASVFQNKL